MNKKAIILVELIFTIVIVSTISVFSMTLLYSLYEKYAKDYKSEILKLDTLATQILLENSFSDALNINVSTSEISFYKIDSKLFDLGYYSRFVDLNNSDTSKYSIYSPNTKAEYLHEYSITFDDENFYAIKNNSYDEVINFEDSSSKNIKEQYKIVSKNHLLNCKDNTLYLDTKILLEDITSCSFSLSTNILTIELKINDNPFIWKYKM